MVSIHVYFGCYAHCSGLPGTGMHTVPRTGMHTLPGMGMGEPVRMSLGNGGLQVGLGQRHVHAELHLGVGRGAGRGGAVSAES